MVVNKSCVAACLESVRMTVESVSGCSWNECPDQRGISVRMLVEWVSGWSWNPQLEPHFLFEIDAEALGVILDLLDLAPVNQPLVVG